MKKYLIKRLSGFIARKFSEDVSTSFIKQVASQANIDLLNLAYKEMGILNYLNYHESGELYLLKEILSSRMSLGSHPVVFDVGANVGKYSLLLKDIMPNATIYAFEPNHNAYETLEKLADNSLNCYNLGLGSMKGSGKIYTYKDSLDSSHASIFPEVFTELYRKDEMVFVEFEIETLDAFCSEHGVEYIDFLKIDTEGNEKDVMLGARRMLGEGRIGTIQFEFGECNVFSRVFLRDFYEILKDFNIYRLDSDCLLPMRIYSVRNEIFRYQNLFAIKKELDTLLLETNS